MFPGAKVSTTRKTSHRPGLLVPVLALVLLPGCIKEKYVLTVYPDGSGKIEITVGTNSALNALIEAGGESGMSGGVPTADSVKSASSGFVTWTDSLAFRSGEFTMSKIVGYFDDINEVRLRTSTEDGAFTTTFGFKQRQDGRYELSVASQGDMAQFESENPFSDARTEEEKEMVRGTLRATMNGFESWSQYRMPGEVVDAHGMEKTGRLADLKIDLDRMIEMLETGKEPAILKHRLILCQVSESLDEEMALFQREKQKVMAGAGDPLSVPPGTEPHSGGEDGHSEDDGHDHGEGTGTSRPRPVPVAPLPPSPQALEMMPAFVKMQARTVVYPDGSGKVNLRIGSPENGTPIDPGVILAGSRGVTAWTEPRTFSAQGAQMLRMTAFFDDINAVRLRTTTDETRETTFQFARTDGGGYECTLADTHLPLVTEEGSNPLGRGFDWKSKNNFRSTLQKQRQGFEMAFSIRMPGAVPPETEGVKVDHRRASFKLGLDQYFERIQNPPEDSAPISVKITSGPDADDLAADREMFVAEYDRALVAWKAKQEAK